MTLKVLLCAFPLLCLFAAPQTANGQVGGEVIKTDTSDFVIRRVSEPTPKTNAPVPVPSTQTAPAVSSNPVENDTTASMAPTPAPKPKRRFSIAPKRAMFLGMIGIGIISFIFRRPLMRILFQQKRVFPTIAQPLAKPVSPTAIPRLSDKARNEKEATATHIRPRSPEERQARRAAALEESDEDSPRRNRPRAPGTTKKNPLADLKPR